MKSTRIILSDGTVQTLQSHVSPKAVPNITDVKSLKHITIGKRRTAEETIDFELNRTLCITEYDT